MQKLIQLSARALGVGYYTQSQIESAIQYVYGVDSQLVADETYFVVEAENRIVGCGGWSKRKTLFGGDQLKNSKDALLDPRIDAAKIRAFFVCPNWARRGAGSLILKRCFEEASACGFNALELMATLPGVPFYLSRGFTTVEESSLTLPDGVEVPLIRMSLESPID